MRIHSIITAGCASALVSACGAWQSASDGTAGAYHAVFQKTVKTLALDLSAHTALNNRPGEPALPVAIRVYQLKHRQAFDAASYDDLLHRDRTVLASDLQDSLGAIVAPGGAINLTQPMHADTRYVAVIAFFRSGAGSAHWRRVFRKKALSADRPLKLQLAGDELVVANERTK